MASYLTENGRDSDKVHRMLSKATKVEWEEATSELHALLRELQLIRQLRPDFNSMLVHPRRFPFIRLDSGRKFDHLDLVYELEDDGRYYGPFDSSYAAEQILYAADRYFKLVKCNEDFVKPFDPCLYFYIDRCSAPCAGNADAEEYGREVEAVEEFLCGSFERVTFELRGKLDELTKRLEFEDAAEIRDMMLALHAASLRMKLLNGPIGKANFVCGWFSEKKFELYRVNKGMVTGPVVAPPGGIESGITDLFRRTDVIAKDFVPLRILLNFALGHSAGFFKVATQSDGPDRDLADNIKDASLRCLPAGTR